MFLPTLASLTTQIVDIEIVVVFRIGDRRLQDFFTVLAMRFGEKVNS